MIWNETLKSIKWADQEEPHNMEGKPTMIPLQFLGVHDMEATQISVADTASQALANLCSTDQESYAVRYSQWPAQDFPPWHEDLQEDELEENIWEQAYPLLFPYGEGGLERQHTIPLSLSNHVQWCLQYHDAWFQRHPTFAFMAFSILQWRQALVSASIHMKRKDFTSIAHRLSSLMLNDLRDAAKQEQLNQPITNAAVRELRKHACLTVTQVMGSNAAWQQVRSNIWSTVASFNAPSVWMTFNPDNLHDPICQVFLSEDINLDNFCSIMGPDKSARARNVGWHTGTAQVSKVQPIPVPVKPAPIPKTYVGLTKHCRCPKTRTGISFFCFFLFFVFCFFVYIFVLYLYILSYCTIL